jgi:segregation and condensation protein B
MERRLVKIVGRAEELGRPMLYGTTSEFLKVFGMASMDDLPQIKGLNVPAAPRPVAAAENAASQASDESVAAAALPKENGGAPAEDAP